MSFHRGVALFLLCIVTLFYLRVQVFEFDTPLILGSWGKGSQNVSARRHHPTKSSKNEHTTTVAPAITSFSVKNSTVAMQGDFVCIDRGRLVTTRHDIPQQTTDNGGTRRYGINALKENEELSNTHVNFYPSLVLGSFTCEGNIHHLMTETLHPVRQAVVEQFNTHDNADEDGQQTPLLAIMSFTDLWKSDGNSTGCHGPRYASMFQALGVVWPTMYIRIPKEPFYPSDNQVWNTSATYCFERTVHSQPRVKSDLETALFAWAAAATGTTGESNKDVSSCDDNRNGVHVVILDRQETRHILNVQELAVVAEKMTNIRKVSVVQLEQLSIPQQVALVSCPKVIYVGVQGAGLQWGTFLKHHPPQQRSVLIQITWRDWNPHPAYSSNYTNLQSLALKVPDHMIACPQNGKYEYSPTCCDHEHKPGTPCKYPTKDFDVSVPVSDWQRHLEHAVNFICNADTTWASRFHKFIPWKLPKC